MASPLSADRPLSAASFRCCRTDLPRSSRLAAAHTNASSRISSSLTIHLPASTVFARVISAVYNFLINYKVVFQSRERMAVRKYRRDDDIRQSPQAVFRRMQQRTEQVKKHQIHHTGRQMVMM